MNNAHLRLAQIEYELQTRRSATLVKVWCDRLIVDEDRGLLMSVFGNESEMTAIAGAVSLNSCFTACLTDGEKITFGLGDKAVSSRGFITTPTHRRPIRHNVYFAQSLCDNGVNGTITVMQNDDALIWASIVSFLGLPATPEWAVPAVEMLRRTEKLKVLEGFRCSPIRIAITRDEMMEWIGGQVSAGKLHLPAQEGPILWPRYELRDLLLGLDADLTKEESSAPLVDLPTAA
jgi:hypothetical protein